MYCYVFSTTLFVATPSSCRRPQPYGLIAESQILADSTTAGLTAPQDMIAQALHTDVNVLFQATTVIEPMVNGPYLVDANNTHVETIGIKHLDNVLTVA